MKDWITNNFPSSPYGGVIVYQDDSGFVSCDAQWLASVLGDTVPPTYEGLSALPLAQQGWQRIFDQWKEKGIVS
jgi:hypothetical protein